MIQAVFWFPTSIKIYVLSYIWTLVADKILNSSKEKSLNLIPYAVDSIVVEDAITRTALEHKINNAVEDFSGVCSNFYLNINLPETVSMLSGKNTLMKRGVQFLNIKVTNPSKR